MANASSIPPDFICPITREIMENPVILIEDVSRRLSDLISLRNAEGAKHISFQILKLNLNIMILFNYKTS
jgi:hypothetical protein